MEQPELIMTKITKQYCTKDVPLLLVFFPLVSWCSQWKVCAMTAKILPIIHQICKSWCLFSHGLIPKMLLKYHSPYCNRDGSVH